MSDKNKIPFEDDNSVDEQNNQVEQDASESINDNDTIYFASDSQNSSETFENFSNEEIENKTDNKKEKKKISIKAFVVSLIAVILASVMLTYSICSALYQSMYAKAYIDAHTNSFLNGNVITAPLGELDIIAQIIKENYLGEVDSDKLMEAAIEEYIKQTGDIYAVYYTKEELAAQRQEDVGKSVGVGINIVNSVVNYNASDVAVLKITNVGKNSPAEKAGVKVGDYVYAAVIDGATLRVNDIGYDDALNKLLGEEGTTASFIVLRENGEALEEISFNIVREKIISASVYYRIPDLPSNADKKIGVVKISNFDYTTPKQFSNAIDDLKAKGCEKFIFDVRNNLGGLVDSVGAVLSYFLNEGDVYMRQRDKAGTITSDTVKVVSHFEGDYAGCNVSKEDIGKYKGLDVVVLCNEYTVSAGELFTATFKDYELGTLVGETTYGKGKLQKTYYLSEYAFYRYGITGIDGAVRITTNDYFSAKSDSYDGIGVEPHEKIQLSEEAQKINVYDFEKIDPVDDQLLKGINILKG